MTYSLQTVCAFLDETLHIQDLPDEPNALNGLQLDASEGARRKNLSTVALSVDATEAVIDEAIALGAELLLVHHGLFWGGNRPLTGTHGRKVGKCFTAGLSVYSAHLPLDVHPTLGNNVGLVQALGLSPMGPFGSHRGIDLGLEVSCDLSPEALSERCASTIGPVRILGKGPQRIHRLAVISGSGGSCLKQAMSQGFDAFLTGESAHHIALDAEEAGIHLILAGHYRTETFGVRALGQLLNEWFGFHTQFIAHDTGL